jgi:hypothetical protein
MVKINYVMYFVKIINGKWNENIRMGDLSNNATCKKKGVPSNKLLISSPPLPSVPHVIRERTLTL